MVEKYMGTEPLREIASQAAVTPAELLDQEKQRLHEASLERGYFVDLGELRADTDPDLWVGKTSLQRRLESGELTLADVEDAKQKLGLCYVPIAPGAAIRCVEDRPLVGYDDDNPIDFLAPLGLQIQGGTPDIALAHRLAKGMKPGATFVSDTRDAAADTPAGQAPGAHAKPGVIDCGSVKNEKEKVDLCFDEAAAPVVFAKTAALYGAINKPVPKNTPQNLQKNAAEFSPQAQKYLGNLSDAVDAVRAINPNGVVEVAGEHIAIFAVADYCDDTLQSSHFVSLTDGKISAFSLNVSAIFKHFPEQEAYNLVAAAVTTLMRITDGTLRLLARVPRTGETSRTDTLEA